MLRPPDLAAEQVGRRRIDEHDRHTAIAFDAVHDLETEHKLSFVLGGGLSYFLAKSLALEGRFAYKPTVMNDGDAGDFCDAFGYCQSALRQFELMGGVRFRF